MNFTIRKKYRSYSIGHKLEVCGTKKRHFQLENVNNIPINTAVNLSMIMVNVSAKLMNTHRCKNTRYSVLELKAHYRGLKYLHETLKILPQKPESIVIQHINEQL